MDWQNWCKTKNIRLRSGQCAYSPGTWTRNSPAVRVLRDSPTQQQHLGLQDYSLLGGLSRLVVSPASIRGCPSHPFQARFEETGNRTGQWGPGCWTVVRGAHGLSSDLYSPCLLVVGRKVTIQLKKNFPKSCIWHKLTPLLVLPVARHRYRGPEELGEGGTVQAEQESRLRPLTQAQKDKGRALKGNMVLLFGQAKALLWAQEAKGHRAQAQPLGP